MGLYRLRAEVRLRPAAGRFIDPCDRVLREFVLVDVLLALDDFRAVFFAPDFFAPGVLRRAVALRVVALRLRAGVLRPGRLMPVADSSRDLEALDLACEPLDRGAQILHLVAGHLAQVGPPRARGRSRRRPHRGCARRGVTTSSTTSWARSRVSPADPTVVCTVRSTARRTASTPVCFAAAVLRAVDFRAVDFRGLRLARSRLAAVDLRGRRLARCRLARLSTSLRAVSTCGLSDLRAVDLRAVDLRAVDFFAELERRAVGMSAA